MLASPTVRWIAVGLIGLGLTILVYILGSNPPPRPPRLGSRGLRRKQAVAAGGTFGTFEPVIRFTAGWMARLPLGDRRVQIDRLITQAGDFLGLTADEFLGLSLLSAVGMTLMGAAMVHFGDLFGGLMFFFAGLGAIMPYMRLTGEMQRRFKQVNRALPTTVDLMSLCMGAGLDFPGALRQVIDKSGGRGDALHEELSRVQQELELGHTRRQALENFAERVPTESVRDFVGAVVQAEEKGNPLADVLQIQANMQRMRRSVMAEEAAAKAGVKMMIPLMLIFAAIIIILLGPFVVTSMQAGY